MKSLTVQTSLQETSYNNQLLRVHNIPHCKDLTILAVTFQDNCKFLSLVREKLVKVNKCLEYMLLGLLEKKALTNTS